MGQQVDYGRVFEMLFSEEAARHAYELLRGQNLLAGAYTEDRATRVWTSWQEARMELANSRPRAALESLMSAAEHAKIDEHSGQVAEAERLALFGECFLAGYQYAPATHYTTVARQTLRRFTTRIKTSRSECADELLKMVAVLTSTDAPEGVSRADQAIVRGWATTRAIDLACDLAKRRARLPRLQSEDDTAVVRDLVDDVDLIERSAAVRLTPRAQAHVDLAIGNILTTSDPSRAFEHFDSVVEALGIEDGLGLSAAVNAANCLLASGQFAEAEARYASLESLFEMMGRRQDAARVWISECIAKWKRVRTVDVVPSLVAAIEMFEETIRGGLEPMTRFTQKRFVDPGYMLLISAIAYSDDRTDTALDRVLCAIRALMSRDALADLVPEHKVDPWEVLLARQGRPLWQARAALATLPGTAVVHLISATDALVWVLFGHDREKKFHFEMHPMAVDHAGKIEQFLKTMHAQLDADRLGDVLRIRSLAQALETLGEQIGSDLPPSFRNVLTSMNQIIYMPHPYGNLDEFPLEGLRVNGQWLGETVPIVRSPSILHFREMLSPNTAWIRPNRNGVVVLGSANFGTESGLRGTQRAADRSRHMLEAVGFESGIHSDAGAAEMAGWLDGTVGAVHYIGHGIADEISEALPLATGELFGILDADRLQGQRVPFLFFCACVAARVRSGAGGYQAGIASRLMERGAPAAVAFSMPVKEESAYALAEQFYRIASERPFGDAMRELRRASKAIPEYARLSLTAYGDPMFRLTSMTEQSVSTVKEVCLTWESRLRNYCVVRTQRAHDELSKSLQALPDGTQTLWRQFLEVAFLDAPVSAELLDQIETRALEAPSFGDRERLSMHAAITAQRLHESGIENVPIHINVEPDSIRRLLDMANFLTRLGGALFDMRLNGLGNSLAARIITVDQNAVPPAAAVRFRQGREKLFECEGESEFVRRLRADDGRTLEHFGVRA
jgi:hypothetical protein